MAASRLLDIEGLHVDFPGRGGVLHAVEGLDLHLEEGEVLGIVGESGSGKSVAMMALMGLIAAPGRVRAQRMAFQGQELQGLAPAQRRRLAGKDMAMIFQDPGTCLNPCFTIGWQLVEAIREHAGTDRAAARRQAIGLLEQVGIPAAASRMDDYPHQLSGGMNQRVMIAMAISCNPRLLIADEPTTALDVTVQAQILDLLQSLQRERGMALVLITHNMGVVGGMADRIAVMYAGQAMELRPAEALLETPAHPYTAALLAALPERGEARQPLATIPGVVPGAWDRPPGCLFAPRCTDATPRCAQQRPGLVAASGLPVRCHYPRSEPGRDAAIAADRASFAGAAA